MPQVVYYVTAAVKWVLFAKGVTAFVVRVALFYTMSRVLAKKPDFTSGLTGSKLQLTKSPTAARRLIYGKTRTSGVLVYAGTSGTQNEYLNLVIAVAGHKCYELGGIYFGEDNVVLDGAGNAVGKYSGHAVVKKHDGDDDQTVDTFLKSAVGSAIWTDDHRLRGNAYLVVQLKHNTDLYPSQIPDIACDIKGKLVYDPRTAGTGWTDNAALCIRDYLTDPVNGLGAAGDELDESSFIEAANISDESVLLAGGGTQKRFTCNGAMDTAVLPGDALAALLTSCGGSLIYIGGAWTLRVAAYRAPEADATITEDDLRGGFTVSTKASRRDTINGVKGTFIGPVNGYQPGDFPPVVNATYLAQDQGERLWRDIELPFTDTPSMAQRLAKIELERARQSITAQFALKVRKFKLTTGNTVKITIAQLGWVNKVFEIVEWGVVLDGGFFQGVNVTVRETAAGIFDWNNGEETTVDLAPNTTLVDPSFVAVLGGLSLSTSNLYQRDGTITPRIRVQWTGSNDAYVRDGGYTEIEYKKSADSTWLAWAFEPGSKSESFIDSVESGVAYDVRARFRNIFQAKSPGWTSGALTVSADLSGPANPTGLAAWSAPGAVALSWTANTETDLKEYRLFRSTAADFSGAVEIWRGLATRASDNLITLGVTYYYKLRAYDMNDNPSTGYSNLASAAPNPATGNFIDYVFKRAAALPATPVGDTPAGWSDSPPAADGNPLWMSKATKTASGVLVGAWSTPVRITGEQGIPGIDGTDGVDGTDGKFVEFVWKRSPTQPAAPTGPGIPAGWADDPPNGADPLWMSEAKQELDGTLVAGEVWSTPIRHDGPAGQDGTDGLDGTDGIDGQDGKFIEFVWKRNPTQPAAPAGPGIPAGWSDDPPTGSDPLWMSKVKQELDGTLVAGEAWSTPIRHDGPAGANGAPGANNAQVFIYKRSASAPALPTATTTYTFATGALTGLNNGWSQAVPATNGQPLYVAVATASSSGASDTIAAGEWSSPVVLAQDGSAGASGLNAAGVFLYKRAASAPSLPTTTSTYTFATGVLTGHNGGWSQTVPATDGNPCWVTLATASSTGATDTIAASEWAAVTKMVQDGADGASVQVEYSVDGASAWHSTFTTGDIYMRQRVGTGAWSAAIRIVGEQGPSGALNKVATPVISFSPASFTSPSDTSTCTITCATAGATIWVTYLSTRIYTGAFTVTKNIDLIAWAEKADMVQSDSAYDMYEDNT